ncbi:hypothetical protein U1Q18_045687 [Sarracenia purpurea var. burkii]
MEARSKDKIKEFAHAQLQVAAGSANDSARYQQGLQAAQDWMWKNKLSGLVQFLLL